MNDNGDQMLKKGGGGGKKTKQKTQRELNKKCVLRQ